MIKKSKKKNYTDLLCKSPHSVLMRENTDQKNSEHEHFLLSGSFLNIPVRTL